MQDAQNSRLAWSRCFERTQLIQSLPWLNNCVSGIVRDDPSHASKASHRSVSFGLPEIAPDRHPHGSAPNNKDSR